MYQVILNRPKTCAFIKGTYCTIEEAQEAEKKFSRNLLKGESIEIEETFTQYILHPENKEEIVRMQRSNEKLTEGTFVWRGKEYPIAKVVLNGLPTWFIEGHHLLTFFRYEPTYITAQAKFARGGDWSNGERREEYQAFVWSVMETLGVDAHFCFNGRTDDYFNEISTIDMNGCHPFDIVK